MHKTLWRWSTRIAVAALFLAGLAFAAVVVALRYWVLPDIGQYREDIATSISRAAGQRVTIREIAADWQGLRPRLELRDVQVYDRQGRPALALQHVDGTLSWWSLLVGELRLYSLVINDPVLNIRRDAEGHLFLAGMELDQSQNESGFADWVLQQSRIVVLNATVEWHDDKRQAPVLTLNRVNLRLENRFGHHRLGMRAVPPAELAGPLDIRADLRGERVADLSTWSGQLYARLDRTDIAAWQSWVTLPFELRHGHGGVQSWLGLDAGKINEVTADVRLDDVTARFGRDLPELELENLRGRLGWRQLPAGFEFRTQRLSMVAKGGINLPTNDFLVHYVPAQGKKIAEGEIRANGLSLEPLLKLSDRLPFPAEARGKLLELSPQGGFRDFSVKWSGDWSAPQRYAIKGGFTGLGMKPYERLPGFSGLSGNIDANESGGTLALNSHDMHTDLPDLYLEPLELDALTAQLSWKRRDKGLEFNLTSLSLANRDLAGNLFGSYKTASGTPGIIDLSGQFTRGDASQVGRYIPRTVGQSTRDWLKTALLAGKSSDVRLRLKGDLAEFPFVDSKRGLFEVAGTATGGVLEYAPGWPKIENIAVDFLFRGARMEITAHQGNTDGMQISRARAVISDLLGMDEILEVDGEAHGPTGDMLKFIDNSPVSAMIDEFTEGMSASGNGDFNLKLNLPLRRNKDLQVSGGYQFVNNRVSIGPDFPALERVNGRLNFAETSVDIPRIAAVVLGGPATISGATQKDGSVRINVQGRANATAMGSLTDQPLVRALSGTADWRGVVSVRKKQADMMVESSLVGLASSLPAPFGKLAASPVPLRFEKKMTGAKQDAIQFNYGKVLAAVLVRHYENGKAVIDRGAINMGAAAVLPPQPGIWLAGEMPLLDLDYWRTILGQGDSTVPLPDFAGVNLKLGALDAFGKRFNELSINAKSVKGIWQANVQGRELAGNVDWNPAGRGQLRARLAYLTIPDAAPAKLGVPVETTKERELPALDITVEDFSAKQKKLGKLELQAVQSGDDWRIDKLYLGNSDGSLQMSGLWQGWRRRPKTYAKVHLDVQDLGKLLTRLGYPQAVKRGTAKLDGRLFWNGSPQDIDYPSLAGDLKLDAGDGQFLKIEPGVGKLLGLLSLQSLPRRLTLDFRDIFSEGFAFDSISGGVRIDHGIARSDDLMLDGPAAKVRMQGETNLAGETQNLKVKVSPKLGEGVSVAGAFLGGPVVGVTAWVAQKLLKDPIDQIASYEYSVTGTWDNPNVVKIGAIAPTELP